LFHLKYLYCAHLKLQERRVYMKLNYNSFSHVVRQCAHVMPIDRGLLSSLIRVRCFR